jgi:hypothetical protein
LNASTDEVAFGIVGFRGYRQNQKGLGSPELAHNRISLSLSLKTKSMVSSYPLPPIPCVQLWNKPVGFYDQQG